MKKFIQALILFFIITVSLNVYAKDTVYSLNKYEEETYLFIKNSYSSRGKVDGQITGGNILKKTFEYNNTTYKDYQVIIAKYNNEGRLVWKYIYGLNKEDYIEDLTYSYDEEGNIDGYLILTEKTSNLDTYDINNRKSVFLKIDLEGKLIFEKESSLDNNELLSKIIPIYNDNKVDGYISIGNKVENNNNIYGVITKYDNNLNIITKNTYQSPTFSSSSFLDIENIKQENSSIGYSIIREYKSDSNHQVELVHYDLECNEIKVLNSSLEEYDSYNLMEAEDGVILYGSTSDVKLKKGKSSYYLINYNSNDEEFWETVGSSPLDKDEKIKLLPIIKDNKISEYLLLYSNNLDNNTSIVKIGSDGTIKEKIKKIYSEYYDVEDFSIKNNTLYLVGQINCPSDDTCEYDSNSLFLISDEDKVIEVKDNTSRNILILFTVFVVLIIGVILYKRKKKLD